MAAALLALLACNLTPATPPGATATLPEVALPSPTVLVLPTSESLTAEPPTPPPGWLTYTNRTFGYSFDYPADAELVTVGVTGYPTEELPAGLDPGQYTATLEATYTEAICAGVRYGAAYLYVMAPEAEGGRYSMPCGVSGIGAYDVRRVEEPLAIGEEDLTVTGAAVYNQDDGSFMYETFMTRLRDFHYNYGGDWTQAGTTYQAYQADKAIIQQVLASWRWLE
jgi:hypothetical protein